MTNVDTALADAYAAGQILHPERFRDIAPGRGADEVYRFMVGAPVYADMQRAYGPLGGRPMFLGSPTSAH
jgi:iron complex transport system substrate-binding protein